MFEQQMSEYSLFITLHSQVQMGQPAPWVPSLHCLPTMHLGIETNESHLVARKSLFIDSTIQLYIM